MGTHIIISLATNEKDIVLVNVYGPNNDNSIFYENLKQKLQRYENHAIELVGDWNLVLDPSVDYDTYCNINNPKAEESVENIIEEFDLTDISREKKSPCKTLFVEKHLTIETK